MKYSKQKLDYLSGKSLWKKISRVILAVLNILVVAVLVIAVVFLIVLLMGSKGNSIPFFSELRLMTVMSGSMEPNLNVGGVIIVKKTDPAALENGDIITFYSNDPMFNGQMVTHRITKIIEDPQLMFITKGDANEDRDMAAALPANVVGKVEYHIPYLGFLLNFMKSKKGIFLVAILPCFFVLILELLDFLKTIGRYYTDKEITDELFEVDQDLLLSDGLSKNIKLKEKIAEEEFAGLLAEDGVASLEELVDICRKLSKESPNETSPDHPQSPTLKDRADEEMQDEIYL